MHSWYHGAGTRELYASIGRSRGAENDANRVEKAATFLVAGVTFSPRGHMVATGGMMLRGGEVQLWRIDRGLSGRMLHRLSNTVEALAFSPMGL